MSAEKILLGKWAWRTSVLMPLAFTTGALLLGTDNEYMLGLFSSLNFGFLYCFGRAAGFGGEII